MFGVEPAIADTTDNSVTETIIVTGTRSEHEAARLPMRIDVIDRESIELDNLFTLAQALEQLPGISTVQGGRAGSVTSVFSRGTNSRHTLALYDGIRLNDPSSPKGAFDFGQDLLGEVERVEVTRGPLSSLYGSDAVGGVVNLIPRVGAESEFAPYGALSVGEFNTFRALAGAAGSTQKARYNTTVEGITSDGFDVTPARIGTATGDPDASEFFTATAIGEYDLTPAVMLSGMVRHRTSTAEFDSFSGGPSGFQRADDPDLEIHNDYTVWRAGLGWTRADDAFSSTVRLGQVSSDRESRANGLAMDTFGGDRTFVEWLNVWSAAIDRLTETSISFGAQFEREAVSNDPVFSDPLNLSEHSFGIYALGTAGLTEAIEVTASTRIDDYEGFGTHHTWNVGAVSTNAFLNTQFFASYGTAFKAPMLSERFSTSPFVIPNSNLDPEESESWEIGVRSSLTLKGRSDALRFGVSYYETEIDNMIEAVFDPNTFLFENQNVGRADISGYEAFMQWLPDESVSLRVDYAYVDAMNANTNTPLLRRPPHSWSARTRWHATERLALSVSYGYVGSRQDTIYDDDGFFLSSNGRVSTYELVHFAGTFNIAENLQAFASLTNAFDEVYEQPAAFAGAPRALTVGLRTRL